MSERSLTEALHALVPEPDEQPDWNGVLRRLPPLERRGRRNRSAPALGLVVLAAVLLVAPALGLHTAVRGLLREDVPFSEAPQAGTVVKRDFADLTRGAPRGMDPRVDAAEARLAGSVGGRRVWVAPAHEAAFCYLVEGLGGGCVHSEAGGVHLEGRFLARPGEPLSLALLGGRVLLPDAARLELVFEDGRRTPLRFLYVSEPIRAGFFAYSPREHERVRGHRPLAVVAADTQGKVLDEQRIEWVEEERKAEHASGLFEDRGRRTGGDSAP